MGREERETAAFELPGTAGIGRVALRVGSIDRVAPFYRDVVGLSVDRDGDRPLLVAGDDPLVALHEDPDAPERPADAAGLFHLAVRVPDRGALADALGRARDSLTGASDHLVSEALYMRDPEGNGVEVYRDRPREEWPRTDDGRVGMETLSLDLEDLAAAGRDDDGGVPPGTDVGHVHLEVADLPRAESFYAGALGMRLRARYGDGGTFLAAGDYHHHVALNTWNGRSAPASGRGIEWFELVLPDDGTLETVERRLDDAGHGVEERDGGRFVVDPDGIAVRLSVDG